MIKKLFITLACMLTYALTVQAATIDEFYQVAKEGTTVCKVYHNPCTIARIEHNQMWANTRSGGDIRVSSKLIDTLNIAELRGVIYHEVGHHVLKHIEKLSDYVVLIPPSKERDISVSEFRKQHELEADRFAIYLGIFINKPTDLIGALITLTPPEEFYKTQATHPSTAIRIRQLEMISRGRDEHR